MTDPVVDPAATPKPADTTPEPSLLNEAGKETPPAATGDPNVLNDAAKAAKEAQEAEDKRILEADPATLNDADKAKRTDLEKAREDKRLLETPKEQLSKEDQDKQAALIKARDEAKAKAGVPEKYEIKVPEGMTLDQSFLDKVTPIFKEAKMSQATAQKLADVYMQQMKTFEDTQAASFKQFLKDSYKETVEALGPEYKKELVYAARVRDRFLSKETKEMLDATGLSNDKNIIIDLIKIGKLISEDKSVVGPGGPTEKSPADTMYPEQGKK